MPDGAGLGAGELIDLALLGRLAEAPRGLEQLIAFIQAACGEELTPTGEVIAARLARLVEAGHVAPADAPGQFAATRTGCAQLLRLLRLELRPGSGRLRSLCTTMKLCFLELVGCDTRCTIVEELISMRRHQLDRLAAARAQPCACPAFERCLALAMQRERAELRWLERLLPTEDHGDLARR
jgi:hypothetical protein